MSKFLKGVELLENEQIEQGYFIPCLTGKGAPSEAQEGAIGSLYLDEDSGDIYKCIAIDDNGYQWVKETKSTAADVGARPDTWMPSASEVGAAPASHVDDKDNPHGVTIAQIGAAPAGYGLGGSAPYKLYNEATETGFNTFWIEPSDGYKGYAVFETIKGSDYPLIVQKFTRADSVNMQRVYLNGTWGEWEFENPPMVPGVEYRTTKRHNGKVVFTQLINFGALPSNGQKNLDISAPNLESLISATVSTKVIQTGRDVNKDITRLAVYHNSIEVTTEREMGQDAEITIEYTKSAY